MGTLRGDDEGGGRPPDGGGLPGLPPEWGEIIIPDDASALDAEASALRRYFRREARRRRWRRRLHLPPAPPRPVDDDRSTMQTPLLIMAIAIIAALASLFTIDWSGTNDRPSEQPSARTPGRDLPSITLDNASGKPVRMRDTLPAVILIVDGCACRTLVDATLADVAATDPRVAVVEITKRGAPQQPPTRRANARRYTLVDPQGSVRAAVPGISRTNAPSAVLVAADGTVVRAVPNVQSVSDFSADIPRLAP